MKSLILKAIKQSSVIRNRVLNKFNTPIIVLMYHRVCDEESTKSPYAVSTSNFKDQMHYIKQHFELLRFEDDWSNVKKPSCVITFDDGYVDNYVIARDFLEQQAIPATFFISTQNIDTDGLFWWDELTVHKNLFEKQTGKSFSTLFKQLKKSKPAEQLAFFNQYRPLYEVNAHSLNSYRSMSSDQLANLAQLKHTTIGAHTINHPKLTVLDAEEMFFELKESKRVIEKITGSPVTTCSYPYGSYNQNTIEVCKKIGFKKAAAGFPHNCYRWNNPLKIPRVSAFNDDLSIFNQKIQQLLR